MARCNATVRPLNTVYPWQTYRKCWGQSFPHSIHVLSYQPVDISVFCNLDCKIQLDHLDSNSNSNSKHSVHGKILQELQACSDVSLNFKTFGDFKIECFLRCHMSIQSSYHARSVLKKLFMLDTYFKSRFYCEM